MSTQRRHHETAETPILERIGAGEADALQACIDRYTGLVWSLARRFGLCHADAEDVVQEIFLDIWKSASRFDASKSPEASFVALIARRRLIDWRRRQRPGREVASTEMAADRAEFESNSTMAPIELEEESARALRALNKLPQEQRQVLRLALGEGWTHREISERRNIPLGTVKTHVRRGLIQIREILNDSDRDER